MSFSNAQKLTAFYVKLRCGYDYPSFLLLNPLIKELRMVNYRASQQVIESEAKLEATEMLGHFLELNKDLEEDADDPSLVDEHTALATLISQGTGKALDLAVVIDDAFKFGDELFAEE